MTSVRCWTRAEAEQAAARALWQAGNDRIGFREWDAVKDHYLLEAGMALDALGLTATFTVTDGHLEQAHREPPRAERRSRLAARLSRGAIVNRADLEALAADTARTNSFAAAARSVLPVLLRRLDLAEQALAAYDKKPGGGAACTICGHRTDRHDDSWQCTRAALEAIRAALAELRRPLDQPDDTT